MNDVLTRETVEDYVLEGGHVWITVKDLSVHIKKEKEGVVVDVYPLGDEDTEPIASTWALWGG